MPPTDDITDNQFEFEIHFAAEAGPSSSRLRDALHQMNFIDDPLAFKGVVFSPESGLQGDSCPILDTHVTWTTFNRSYYFTQLEAFNRLLDEFEGNIQGYSHAEVIRPEWDIDISRRPLDTATIASCPIRPFASEPSTSRKVWDIHISARLSTLDSRMLRNLHHDLNLYYIDLEKPHGVARIFTLQGDDGIPEARNLFKSLTNYLSRAGGLEGSIKFEQTIFWRVLGSPEILPPRLIGSPSNYITD